MKKSILFALLAITGTMLCADDAFARGRRSGGRKNNCCASSSCSACNNGCSTCSAGSMMAPMVASNAAMALTAVAQSRSGSNYQSFSYEPGSSQVAASTAATWPTYVAPDRTYQSRQTNSSEFNNVLNGGRKVLGHRAQGE